MHSSAPAGGGSARTRPSAVSQQPQFDNWGGGAPASGSMDPAAKAATAEYETEVHFRKCYGVMAELFELHNHMVDVIPSTGFRFLDLGCAPGGFSSYLLDDPRCKRGFGVTLPSAYGGFPMRLRRDNFMLQHGDLFEIGLSDLIAADINICICDAQYLRNNISWDEQYRGVRCRSKQHGVWALLLKQFWLGLSRLMTGGMLIFRFGWRDPGPEDPATVWYKKITLRMFTLLYDLFDDVREVKSDYFNALQASFYVCCLHFDAERFASREVGKLLGNTFNMLISTQEQDYKQLEILSQVDKIRTDEVDAEVSEMLDRINKLRLVHEQSRRIHEQSESAKEDPLAVVTLRPVPAGASEESLSATFSVYGRVQRVLWGAAGEVSVRFAKLEHARAAVAALRGSAAFGRAALIWTGEEEACGAAPLPQPSSDSSCGGGSGGGTQGGKSHKGAPKGSDSGKGCAKGKGYEGKGRESRGKDQPQKGSAGKGGGDGRRRKGDEKGRGQTWVPKAAG